MRAKTQHSAQTFLIGAIAVAVVVTGVVVTIALMDRATSTTRVPTSVTVNDESCGEGWLPPHSGQREIPVTNAGNSVVDVTLLGSNNLLIYGEIEAMAPGATRTLTAVIPPGRFRLGCTYFETSPSTRVG